MDKLTALRVFRRVAELASFSATARDLRLSNAAVSKNVRELEEELGAPLLQRTTRRVHLTAAGEQYYARVVSVLDELESADEAVSEQSNAVRGRLRVAAPMSFGLSELAAHVAAFGNLYPELTIELELNDRFVDVIQEGFDVAVRGSGPLPDSNLVAKKLLDIERMVCASPEYVAQNGEPKSPQALTRHRCLVYSLSSRPGVWTFHKGKTKATVELRGPLLVNSSLALATAAAEGAGVVLLPQFAAKIGLASGRLVRLLPDWSSEAQALYALYPRHRFTSRIVKLFVAYLSDQYPARGVAESSIRRMARARRNAS
ncbi:MAG TPA: LysR substrate-binding domain-containing protein [Polyangiaceae bacterium]|nr:LysR substrate-binding domain-containing protein [Polyangiaceae bacterium]